MQIVHRAAVILGIDDRGDRAGEPHQIGVTADFREIRVGFEILLQRNRVGDLTTIDQPGDRLEDPAVHAAGEVFRLQELGDPLERTVVVQDRAEQRHLGFVVVRRRPVDGQRHGFGRTERSDGRAWIHQMNLAERLGIRPSHHATKHKDNGDRIAGRVTPPSLCS